MLNHLKSCLTAPQFIHTTLIFLFGSALIAVLASSFVFVSPLFNLSSLFATSVLIAVLLAATSFAHIYRLVGLELTLIVLFLFLVVRIVQYQFVPFFVVTPFPDFTADEISNGLWGLVSFLTLFLFGLGAGEKALKPKSQEKPPTKTSSSFKVPFFTLLLIYLALKPIELIVFGDPANSIFSIERGADLAMANATKVFVVFFSSDAFLFAILVLTFLSQDQMTGKTRRLINCTLIILIFFEILVSSLLGSRGGGLRIFMMVLCIFLALERNKISLFLAIVFSTIAIIANYASLDFAQAQRAKLNSDIGSKSLTGSGEKTNLPWLFNRLGYADYLIITLAREPDKDCSEKYMQMSYYSKNVINFISPGNPYPEAKISSSNAFGPCYRDPKISNFSFYHSEVWGLAGLLKLAVKNTLLVLISGLGIGLILGSISSLAQHGQSFGSRLIHIHWIYLVPYISIFSMGVDHSINTTITVALRLVTVLILIQVSKVLFKHCRR